MAVIPPPKHQQTLHYTAAVNSDSAGSVPAARRRKRPFHDARRATRTGCPLPPSGAHFRRTRPCSVFRVSRARGAFGLPSPQPHTPRGAPHAPRRVDESDAARGRRFAYRRPHFSSPSRASRARITGTNGVILAVGCKRSVRGVDALESLAVGYGGPRGFPRPRVSG